MAVLEKKPLENTPIFEDAKKMLKVLDENMSSDYVDDVLTAVRILWRWA